MALIFAQPLGLAAIFVAHNQSAPRANLPTNGFVPEPPCGSRLDLNVAEPEKIPATYVFPAPSSVCFGADDEPPVTFADTGQPEPTTRVVNILFKPKLVTELWYATMR